MTTDGASAPLPGARSMAGRFGWALAGTVASQGSVFLVAVVNARLLGQADFGKLAMLQSGVVTVSSFAAVGLGVTATRFVAQYAGLDGARVGRILGLCSAATLLTAMVFAGGYLLAAPWAATLFNLAGLESQLRLSCLQVLFLTLNAFQVGALGGFSAFGRLARIGIIQGVLSLTLASVGTWVLGLTGAVLALGLASASSWGQHQLALREECRRNGIAISYRGMLPEVGLLWRFALPSAMSGWVGGFAVTAASTLLVRQADGPQALAIFNAANTVRIAVLFVPSLVSRVSTPLLCRLSAPEDAVAYRRTFWRYLGVTSGLAGAMACLMAVGGPWILWLFGKDFVGGSGVLAVLMVVAVLEATSVGLFQTIYSNGLIWRQVAISSLWGATLVTLAGALAVGWGAMALAVAYLVAWGISTVLYGLTARAILREQPARGAT